MPTLRTKVATATKSVATGLEAITGVGFPPVAVIFWTLNLTAQDTVSAHATPCIGFSDGTTDKCIWDKARDGLTTSQTDRISLSNKSIHMRNETNALIHEAHVDSLDDDGFTLDWTTGTAAATVYHYMAIGGGIMAEVGSFLGSISTGNQSVATGLAAADYVMILGIGRPIEDQLLVHSLMTVGMSSGSGNEAAMSVNGRDNVGTMSMHRVGADDDVAVLMSALGDSTTRIGEAQFTAFTSSGFDLNWSLANAGPYHYYYLTIKGGQWEVGNGTYNTIIGTKAYPTSFRPVGAIIQGHDSVSRNATDARRFFGASDGSTNVTIATMGRDNVTTSEVSQYHASEKVLLTLNGPGTATETEAAVDSFNATDFTLDYTKTDSGAARRISWTVMGSLSDSTFAGATPGQSLGNVLIEALLIAPDETNDFNIYR